MYKIGLHNINENVSQKPKQPQSAWFIYISMNRKQFKEQNPSLKMCEITKILHSHYQIISEKER